MLRSVVSRSSIPKESVSASKKRGRASKGRAAALRQDQERLATGGFHLFGTGGRLQRQPNILAHLDQCARQRVLSCGRHVSLAPKEVLFRQGDQHRGIFVIETGLIRTYYTSPAGREITLAYWQPGNFVGGPDVFGDSVHMWSGVAVRPSTVMVFAGSELHSLMLSYPALALGIVEALVFKGKCFSALVQMLGTRSVSDRLLQLLVILSELYGEPGPEGGVLITAGFTHEDLAHMVGASRQWVTTTLDRLQKQQIVRIRKRQIIVLQPARLRARELRRQPSALSQ